ncbi:PREDICTED: F-box/kelch-repeat protein At3g13680-like [Camelina sativa]|uniref:F-box/kelch-repeat protein At3g13680-like n=1 Tax=Camelina sativa TaxID=90675 RepID=A0ABM0XRF9_CAMSA|nr:PREDICTED: F-box/kelch-repeat protein At3g13680-like [Camelina sativa]
MNDLPRDLVEEEILSRVPFTSLKAIRSTCKYWNGLSKKQIIGKKAARKNQLMGFLTMDYSVFSMKFDLQGIHDDDDDDYNSVSPSVKQVSVFDQIKVTEILHCDGLLLCVLEDRLLVWNPYLGQTRWIQPRENFYVSDRYAIGYDNNRNHKILRVFGEQETVVGYEIYDLSSSSWSVFDVTPDWECKIPFYQGSVSLKGHAYFLGESRFAWDILVSFDFTTERFGPPLLLPSCDYFPMSLSCVREEQLAVLYLDDLHWEIWITNKIDPYEVSWSKLHCLNHFSIDLYSGSFLIDEEENVAVVFDLDHLYKGAHQQAHILVKDDYYKSVNLRETRYFNKPCGERVAVSPVCSSYVPSLVQLQINQPGKEKETHL